MTQNECCNPEECCLEVECDLDECICEEEGLCKCECICEDLQTNDCCGGECDCLDQIFYKLIKEMHFESQLNSNCLGNADLSYKGNTRKGQVGIEEDTTNLNYIPYSNKIGQGIFI